LKSVGLFILCGLCLLSCTSSDTQLKHINGYWEIVSAVNAAGDTKEFTVNQIVDYIEINDHKGFRKKLQPDLSGNYKTTESTEYIEANIIDDQIILLYSTPFSSWQEVVIEATAHKLVVENDTKIKYTYKRYKPLNLN